MFERSADESAEQRVRLQRLRLELRMELATQIPRMIRELADFDVYAVGSFPGQAQSVLGQDLFIVAIEFVTMTMTLTDLGLAVGLAGETVFCEQAGIGAQAHGAAPLVDALPFPQFVYDAI